MKGVLAVFGSLAALVGSVVWGLFYRTGDELPLAHHTETVCLVIGGAEVPAIDGGSCRPVTQDQATPTCRASAWGNAFNFTVPYQMPGIESVKVARSGVGDVPPSAVGMRRGRLVVPTDRSSARTPWGPGVTWTFVHDDHGSIIVFRPNSHKTVYFEIPTTRGEL